MLFSLQLFTLQYAAIIKRKVREFVNRGGNASNSKEFASAISSSTGVANVTVLHGGTSGTTKNPPVSISNIKELNDFEFHSGGIVARHFSNFGSGKWIEFRGTAMEHFEVKTKFNCDIEDEDKLVNWKSQRSTLLPYKKPGQQEEQKESTSEIEDIENLTNTDISQQGTLFRCPRSPCVAQFIRSDRRDAHMIGDICKILKPHPTLKGKVSAMYISAYGVGVGMEAFTKQKEAKSMVLHLQNLPTSEVPSTLEQADSPLAKANATFNSLFPSGFALKLPSKKTKFTEDQLLYIEEKFEQGRPSTANKAKPNVVAKQMREETVEDKNGVMRQRFPPELWLKEEQIRSLFSKMALNIRTGEIQHVQENPTEDVFVAEAQLAEDEEQGNLFDANVESHSILEVKRKATQRAEDEAAGHPLMVRDRMRLYSKFEPTSTKHMLFFFSAE